MSIVKSAKKSVKPVELVEPSKVGEVGETGEAGEVVQIAKPVKLVKPSKVSRSSNDSKRQRIATRAPLAIGSLVASLTAKVARKKPQVKMLEILARNWREILPQEISENFAEQTRPLKIVYVKTVKTKIPTPENRIQKSESPGSKSPRSESPGSKTQSPATRSQKKATLTLAVTKGFAPIAIHQLDQIISLLNTYLGEEVIETIVLQQKNMLN